MSYKAKIVDIEKARHQARNENFLDVKFEIADADDEVVDVKRIGLDPNSTKAEVVNEVQNYVQTYQKEQEQAVIQKKIDKQDENVEMLKEELVGGTVTEAQPQE